MSKRKVEIGRRFYTATHGVRLYWKTSYRRWHIWDGDDIAMCRWPGGGRTHFQTVEAIENVIKQFEEAS